VIVDTSALLAVVLNEGDGPTLAAAMVDAPEAGMSVANFFEAAIVLERRGDAEASARLDPVAAELGLAFHPVTVSQMRLAREAYRRFGKGRHPAALNFGDCFAYALAAERGEPLLFKGSEFAQTDVARAV
jgi:ribonuclease VapC